MSLGSMAQSMGEIHEQTAKIRKEQGDEAADKYFKEMMGAYNLGFTFIPKLALRIWQIFK